MQQLPWPVRGCYQYIGTDMSMSEGESAQKAQEPRGVAKGAARRRDPFSHGDLPQRPNYLPEEGDVGWSDLWAIVRGVIVTLLVIAALGWLLTQ